MILVSEAQKRTSKSLESFFSPDGEMVTKFGGKARWSQAEMAQTINRGFFEGKSLLVEAPTGTGKTLAYLIPIAMYRREFPDQRFIISVSTKHLQSQIEEDLEKYSDSKDGFPELRDYAILKGASNYLCLNRLKRAARRPHNNSQIEQEMANLIQAFGDLENLPHGWREELPFKISDQTWSLISGEGTCCKTGMGCYRKQAKKLAADAKIVVVNSDLLGYNVKYAGKPIPGKASDMPAILVMDEAHTLLSRLIEVESADVSFRSLEKSINTLTRDASGDDTLKLRVMRISSELDGVRQRLISGPDTGPDKQLVIRPDDPTGRACRELVQVVNDIKRLATSQKEQAPNDEVRQDYQDMETKLGFTATTLDGYLTGRLQDYVMLMNRSTSSNGATAVNLELKPFDLSVALEKLWGSVKQVTLVSATLIGTSIPETKKTFNAADWNSTNYPSPFNYKQQMRVFLPPKKREIIKPMDIAEQIKQVAAVTEGRLMALFTNYQTIAEVTQLLTPWCKENDIQLYPQERNLSPEHLVNLYRANPKAIILGNRGMWTGVDVRLRALVVTKFPFEQQSAYKEARQKFLEAKGVNPFHEDTLPDTIRCWKQGVGRLIRTESQKGLLVLLDPKLNTATYAQSFLKALPSGSKATHLDDPQYPLPTKQQFADWINPPEVKTPALA